MGVAAGAVDASRWMTSRPSRREISKPQGATEPVGLSSCRCICGYRYEGQPRYRHVRFCCVRFLGRMGREWPVW
jgi:hypothetical protein